MNLTIFLVDSFDSWWRVSVEGFNRAIARNWKVLIVTIAHICAYTRTRTYIIKKLSKLSKPSTKIIKSFVLCAFQAVDSLVRVGGEFLMAKLREKMPGVAKLVSELREVFGNEFIDDRILRAKNGEPTFYAEEGEMSFGVKCNEIGKSVSLKDVVIGNPLQQQDRAAQNAKRK